MGLEILLWTPWETIKSGWGQQISQDLVVVLRTWVFMLYQMGSHGSIFCTEGS